MTRAGSARSSPAEWLVGATLRSTTEGPRANAERTRRYAAELVTLAPDTDHGPPRTAHLAIALFPLGGNGANPTTAASIWAPQ